MTDVAIVAGPDDGVFANAVRAVLSSAGIDASILSALPSPPSGSVVVLWSRELDALQSIDAQSLVGLWSESRLTLVLRDATPLPLGLRDLPALPIGTEPQHVGSRLTEASSSAARFSATKRKSSAGLLLALVAGVVIIVGSGGYYYLTAEQRSRQAAMTVMLEEAARASMEVRQAQAAQIEALKALEQARATEETARKAGDVTGLKRAQEDVARLEADAAKAALLVKQGEAEALKAREQAKKSQDAAKSAKAEAVPKAAAPAPVAAAPTAARPPPVAEAPKAEAPRPKSVEVMAKEPKSMSHSDPPDERLAVEVLYRRGSDLEAEGRAAEAVRLYRRAARGGSGKAAKRLGDIYDRGVPGVSRDYAESLAWYQTARNLGESVPTFKARGSSEVAPAIKPEPRKAPVAIAKASPAKPLAALEPARTPPASEIAKAAPVTPAPAPPAPVREDSGWGRGEALIGLMAVALVVLLIWRRRRARREKKSEVVATVPPAFVPTGAPTLFVSYSHKDRKRIDPIVSVIEAMGRHVWMDRNDITGQTGWAGQIVRAIRECRAVVLMASPNSYASDQVVRELYLAMNHKKTIVPIEIEPAELPDELQYILAPFQHHRLSGGETREVLGRALSAV
jgi:tetratricopeptide (TPR) repeat protein